MKQKQIKEEIKQKLEGVKVMGNVIKKLLLNEKDFLTRVDAIKAETNYTYGGVMKLVKEEDYERLFKLVLKHHHDFVKIIKDLEKLE